MSAPHGFPSPPPASSASLGAPRSSNTEQGSPDAAAPLRLSGVTPPEPEPRTISQTSGSSEQTRADTEKQQTQSGVPPESDGTPVRKPSHFHRVDHSTDDDSFNSSSQYEGYSSFTTHSRMDVSSVLEHSSLLDDGGSRADDSVDSDIGFPARKDDGNSRPEEGASTDMDTTRESLCSPETSRNDTLESTMEGEASETPRTLDSLESTGVSILDSYLNDSSQIQDSSVASDDVSRSLTFASPQPSHKGKNRKIKES